MTGCVPVIVAERVRRRGDGRPYRLSSPRVLFPLKSWLECVYCSTQVCSSRRGDFGALQEPRQQNISLSAIAQQQSASVPSSKYFLKHVFWPSLTIMVGPCSLMLRCGAIHDSRKFSPSLSIVRQRCPCRLLPQLPPFACIGDTIDGRPRPSGLLSSRPLDLHHHIRPRCSDCSRICSSPGRQTWARASPPAYTQR